MKGSGDAKETETNVTVSHEEDDVIMAESGLNLAELDMQDDRELIHMVLEDANFEQELEGDPTACPQRPLHTSSSIRDSSGFYSTSPSPVPEDQVEDQPLSLEAWLADPEHAVIFRDSALLASLDIDLVTPPGTPVGTGMLEDVIQRPSSSNGTCQSQSSTKKRISYTQWKRMRIRSKGRNNPRAVIS